MNRLPLVVRVCAAIALVMGLVSISVGQNREKFGISAKAGGVNSVSGRVMVKREGQEPQLLSSQDDLVSGDTVTTGTASQAEILLNPGSYFRLGENSEFMLVNNSLNSLLVKLIRGSAIIEATGADYTELRIDVATDQGRVVIVRRGIYRINAQAGSAEVLVRNGRVLTGDVSRQIVKSGKRITFTSGVSSVAKLTKSDQKDEFDNWSKERGKTLARANEKLSARTLNGLLASNDSRWYAGFGRSGLWTFSPSLRCYTFLPFHYNWASPYGGYYGSLWPIYGYYDGGCCGRRPSVTHNPGIVNNPPSSGGSSGGTGGVGGSPSGPSAPMTSRPSQAAPRDPDSGGRRVPRGDN